jgi:hypothetical protein
VAFSIGVVTTHNLTKMAKSKKMAKTTFQIFPVLLDDRSANGAERNDMILSVSSTTQRGPFAYHRTINHFDLIVIYSLGGGSASQSSGRISVKSMRSQAYLSNFLESFFKSKQ